MRRVFWSRRHHADLLRRPPPLDAELDPPAHPIPVSRVDQLRALVDLLDRGLLSEEEFTRQQGKVFEPMGP